MEFDRHIHCKNCLEKKQPSSIMEAGFKDDELVIACKNCGLMTFVTTLAPELVKKIVKKPCPCCSLKEEDKFDNKDRLVKIDEEKKDGME